MPFTTYYGLVNAIPKDWKANLTNPIPNVTHANTTVNSLRTSSIYSSLLNTVFVPPTAETKILRHGFTKTTIKNVYLMPFKVTNEVKIIMFQYKVIHNRLCKYILKNKNLQNATKTEKEKKNHARNRTRNMHTNWSNLNVSARAR